MYGLEHSLYLVGVIIIFGSLSSLIRGGVDKDGYIQLKEKGYMGSDNIKNGNKKR